MQAPTGTCLYACVLALATLVALSHQATIKGNNAGMDRNFKAQGDITVEHELQALVDAGVLDASPDSMVAHKAFAARSDSRSMEPAELARAATLVDAKLKANAKAQARETDQAQARTHSHQKPRDVSTQKPVVPRMAETANGVLGLTHASEKPVNLLTAMDLAPVAVAEYLFITGDFGGFEHAIGDLIMANLITVAEASQYKDAVSWEYEALLYKLVNRKAATLKEFIQPNKLSSKSNSISQGRSMPIVTKPGKASAMLPPHKLALPGVDIHNKLRQLQMRALVEKEETLDELLGFINQNAVEGPAGGYDYFTEESMVSKRSSKKSANSGNITPKTNAAAGNPDKQSVHDDTVHN